VRDEPTRMTEARSGHVPVMGAVLVPVLLVLIVIVVGVGALKRFGADTVAQSDRLQASERPTLRYLVPPGQDAAVVLGALREAGYDASPDSEPGPSSPVLIIGGPTGGGLDREGVRDVLARIDQTNVNPEDSAPLDLPPVRFSDE
jgi:hypothetical protein